MEIELCHGMNIVAEYFFVPGPNRMDLPDVSAELITDEQGRPSAAGIQIVQAKATSKIHNSVPGHSAPRLPAIPATRNPSQNTAPKTENRNQ